uniref:RING-type domain-containing protein n=1 Tax=Panagrellus redivivus TaxID=6233 RepID=A0A7E4VU74_PANRE
MSSVAAHALRAVAVKGSNKLANDEGDLAFLKEKPKVGSRKSGKGRRNGYLLQGLKQEGDKAVFYKELLNDETLSKKRRARLMSELNKDFNFDVAYSLNRKYRWEDVEDAADLMAKDNSIVPDSVDVAGADTYLRMQRSSTVSAYHDMNEDGTVETTSFKNPHRGIKMNQLSQTKKDKKRSSKRLAFAKKTEETVENPKPTVQYVLSKVQPVQMLLGGSAFREKSFKTKRPTEYNEDFDLETSMHADVDEDTDMTASMAALYRAPRERNFSLGDFITENSTAPVVIQPKSIETIEMGSDSAESDSASVIDDSLDSPVDQHALCKESFFDELEINANQVGVPKDFTANFEKLAAFPELRFRWLDTEKTRCVVDLTLRLDEHASKIALVVVVEKLGSKDGKLRVLLNGSFPRPAYLVEYIRDKTFTSASDFVDRVAEKSQKMYINSRAGRKSRADLTSLNAVYHAHQLAQAVEPCGDYKILADAAVAAPTVEAIVVDVPHRNSESEPDDDEDLEFVVVDMDDFIDSDAESTVADDDAIQMDELEVVPDFDTGCDFCAEADGDDLHILEGCGHRFCRHCLRTELTAAIVRKSAYPLTCLHASCKAHIRLDVLPTLVPLPLVQYYMRFAFMAETVASGKSVVECPHCHDLAAVETKPTYGTVKCAKCSICFCARCQRQPHFPLSCGQLAAWEEKFEKQYLIDLARSSPSTFRKCPCGELLQNTTNHHTIECKSCAISYLWKTGQPLTPGANDPLTAIIPASLNNVIAAEYSEIASLAHVTRFNLKANRQITKDMCKTVDFRLKQAFIEMRKLALHLIEFGFAWLYMTRAERPTHWSTVKATLTGLRTKLDAMHATITGGGLEEKIVDFNGLTTKALDEFAGL